MPTPTIMSLPKTQSPEEFEKICRDVLKVKYFQNFELYARKGHSQDGIDIVSEQAFCDDGYVVAQCKNYLSKNTKTNFKNKIKEDIEKCNGLGFPVTTIIIMTAFDRDKDLQEFVRTSWPRNTPIIMFWDEITELLCANNSLLERYYPSLIRDDYFLDKNKEIIQNIWISSIKRYEERVKNYLYDEKILGKIHVDQDYLDLEKVLEKERFVWLYGDGGSGKTSQVIHTWGNLVQNNNTSFSDVQTIPVYIPLQWFNNVTQVESHKVIFYYLQQEYLEGITGISLDDVKNAILSDYCRKYNFVFFFDGFNELPFQEIGGRVIPKVIIGAISKLEERDNIRYVITSRNKYEKNENGLNLNIKDFKIEPLPNDTISKYLGGDNWKDTAIADLLDNPMMLSMYQVVKKAGDDGEQIREKKDLLEKYYLYSTSYGKNIEHGSIIVDYLLPAIAYVCCYIHKSYQIDYSVYKTVVWDCIDNCSKLLDEIFRLDLGDDTKEYESFYLKYHKAVGEEPEYGFRKFFVPYINSRIFSFNEKEYFGFDHQIHFDYFAAKAIGLLNRFKNKEKLNKYLERISAELFYDGKTELARRTKFVDLAEFAVEEYNEDLKDYNNKDTFIHWKNVVVQLAGLYEDLHLAEKKYSVLESACELIEVDNHRNLEEKLFIAKDCNMVHYSLLQAYKEMKKDVKDDGKLSVIIEKMDDISELEIGLMDDLMSDRDNPDRAEIERLDRKINNNISAFYNATGDYDRAYSHRQKVLEKRKEVLYDSEDKPYKLRKEVAITYRGLGTDCYYQAKKKLEESIEQHELGLKYLLNIDSYVINENSLSEPGIKGDELTLVASLNRLVGARSILMIYEEDQEQYNKALTEVKICCNLLKGLGSKNEKNNLLKAVKEILFANEEYEWFNDRELRDICDTLNQKGE